jgi:hypothetical protein
VTQDRDLHDEGVLATPAQEAQEATHQLGEQTVWALRVDKGRTEMDRQTD